MDLSKLKAFIVVAEELNFRKSAEILGMSQPPLTRLINSLEEELSTQLFVRTTRQVKLTGAGVFLLKEGREILEKSELLEKEVRAIGKLKSGKLSVGFSTATFLASLPKIIREFENRFPKLQIELQQETYQGVIKGLKKGRFDICFVEGTIRDSELKALPVHDETLGVLLPRKHRLSQKKEIELKELKNETIILHPRKENTGFYDTISQLFQRAGINPKTYTKKEKEICPILVATGKGVSLTIAGSQNLVPAETSFVPIQRLSLPVSALWLADNQNPSLKSFLGFVAEKSSYQNQKPECLMDVMRL